MDTDISLTLHLHEDDVDTVVRGILNLRGEHFEAEGRARRNPADPRVPIIGEELGIARMLGALQMKLMEAAQDKIAGMRIPL